MYIFIEEYIHFRNESASRKVTLECLIKGKRKLYLIQIFVREKC